MWTKIKTHENPSMGDIPGSNCTVASSSSVTCRFLSENSVVFNSLLYKSSYFWLIKEKHVLYVRIIRNINNIRGGVPLTVNHVTCTSLVLVQNRHRTRRYPPLLSNGTRNIWSFHISASREWGCEKHLHECNLSVIINIMFDAKLLSLWYSCIQ